MSSMPSRDEVLDLMGRVSALTGPILGDERREVPRHYLELFALYDRCRSMHAAIRLLIERRFVQEAMILSRPLLTDSLAFAELAASNEAQRAALLIGWERHSLREFKKVALEGQRTGMTGFDKLVAFTDERLGETEAYARAGGYGYKDWAPDKHAKALAAKHDRESEYLDVLVSHQFVHPTTFATSQRYADDEDGITVGGSAVETDLWGVTAGCSAAQSVLLASRSLCEIVETAEPADLGLLLDELQTLADRIKTATELAPDVATRDE